MVLNTIKRATFVYTYIYNTYKYFEISKTITIAMKFAITKHMGSFGVEKSS